MSFILYLLAGALAGVLGGMGMGGGTVLIPILTIFLGVSQHVAQATNVIAFLPMAAFALPRHKKAGYLRMEGILFIIIPALVSSAAFSLIASVTEGELLGKLFGAFLIALAVKGLLSLRKDISQGAKGQASDNSSARK